MLHFQKRAESQSFRPTAYTLGSQQPERHKAIHKSAPISKSTQATGREGMNILRKASRNVVGYISRDCWLVRLGVVEDDAKQHRK